MSKEAMKLALEALRKSMQGNLVFDEAMKSFKALEEALAKQEQGKSFFKFRECEDSQVNQTKQEHGEQDEFLLRGVLAGELKCWHRLTADESQNLIDFVKNMGAKQEQGEPVAHINQNGVIHEAGYPWGIHNTLEPLCRHPPQQRTWVGLTDVEKYGIADNSDCYEDAIDAVEAKLKEKNYQKGKDD
jgi:hypothetical protein